MKHNHWADIAAEKIIKQRGNKKQYVIAAGITPSGTIHIGNFREIITVDLVAKALKDKGKNVRFIYSWDNIDVFRKIPKNLPKQDLLKKYLRKPLFLMPDVFNCHKSYAEHNEAETEQDLPLLGISPKFIYQHKKYLNNDYAKEIKTALEKTEKIKSILNKYRKEPLKKDWLPIFVFCDKCKKDTIKDLSYEGNYKLSYKCLCNNKKTIDFRKEGIVTLRWRIDWPMRQYYEKVDFEPAGKDHYTEGGSRTTGEEIIKEVYNADPPLGFVYEWLSIKGGKQFASSLGQVITLAEMLEVYEPRIIRYLFAGTRPNTTFEISFDLDVLKIYEDFDRVERIYFGKEKESEKETLKQKRIYELSSVKLPKKMSEQISFRHLTNLLQLQGSIEKTIKQYKIKNKERVVCAFNWLKKYAPEDFKFKLNEKISSEIKKKLNNKQKKALKLLTKKLEKKKYTEQKLFEEFYNICKEINIDNKEFFKGAYLALIGKERGPKLANFILTIGTKKTIDLLKQI